MTDHLFELEQQLRAKVAPPGVHDLTQVIPQGDRFQHALPRLRGFIEREGYTVSEFIGRNPYDEVYHKVSGATTDHLQHRVVVMRASPDVQMYLLAHEAGHILHRGNREISILEARVHQLQRINERLAKAFVTAEVHEGEVFAEMTAYLTIRGLGGDAPQSWLYLQAYGLEANEVRKVSPGPRAAAARLLEALR
jgi:hypothetical protein